MLSQIKREYRRRMEEESLARLVSCLERLSLEQIWFAPNENCNSVGNLILHLEGNITQWIMSGLGNLPDHRSRPEEFVSNQDLKKEELIERITRTIHDSVTLVDSLDEADVMESRNVQVFEEDGISILIHVIEHTSYHTGQVTLLTKMMLNLDTGYYKGLSLS